MSASAIMIWPEHTVCCRLQCNYLPWGTAHRMADWLEEFQGSQRVANCLHFF